MVLTKLIIILAARTGCLSATGRSWSYAFESGVDVEKHFCRKSRFPKIKKSQHKFVLLPESAKIYKTMLFLYSKLLNAFR